MIHLIVNCDANINGNIKVLVTGLNLSKYRAAFLPRIVKGYTEKPLRKLI